MMKRRSMGRGKLRARLRSEDGFTLLEVVTAITLLAVGALALAGTFGASGRLLVQARQRQIAAEEANALLEHIRDIPYDRVLLSESVTHSSDATHPNYWVSNDGTGYDWQRSGTHEPLAIDLDAGEVPHRPQGGTAEVTPTTLELYQYVTWVDDPVGGDTSQDYKRVSVVVVYSAADNAGRPNTVQVTALLTPGSVSVQGTTPGEEQGSGSDAGEDPPAVQPTGDCSTDVTPPTVTVRILSSTGAQEGFTNSTQVAVNLAITDQCPPFVYRLSNDGSAWGAWGVFSAQNPTSQWAIPAGDGLKSVWAQVEDAVGHRTTAQSGDITLDATPPTVPGTLTVASITCAGQTRTVSLSWGVATDTHLLGYRIYRRINGAAWEVLATSSTANRSDEHDKSLNSVEYRVTAYDKAGNEGIATNVVSLSKNQCR